MDSGILIFLVLSVSFTVYMCVDKIADVIKIKARLENGLDENGKMREEIKIYIDNKMKAEKHYSTSKDGAN